MRILGVDPGYAIVGWGIVDHKVNRFITVDYGAILTSAGTPFNERLEVIFNEFNAICTKYSPEAIAIEKLFFNSNQKTVIDVAQARGVLMLSAQINSIPVFEYTPLQVKQSVVGYGRAEKKQIQEMVKRLLNLEKIPKPDDTADALAMAVCHAHSSGSLGFSSLNNLKIRNGI